MSKSLQSPYLEQVEALLGKAILENDKNYAPDIMKVFGLVPDPGFIVGELRSHGNYTLGVLLTAVEAALGDSKQADALKAIVRREMFALMDRNQGEVYVLHKMQAPGLTPRETRVDGQDELR